jgi:hypothetical protein
MRPLKFFGSIMVIFLCTAANNVNAQTREDIFNGSSEISWLGLDFSQAKFIGTATQFKDAGEITNAEMRDKYIPGWNQLFLDEMKKYNVAEAVHRAEVKYEIGITDKANSNFKGDFFSSNSDDYRKLDEEKIKKIVKGYDFKGKTGIGLLFFIDGMSKGKEEANAWVTFVDMKSKTVLFTKNQSGKPKGFGFKNYWAGSFLDILKSAKSNYNSWKQSS